jgi:hypothetical protein
MKDGNQNGIDGRSDGDEDEFQQQRVGTFPFGTTMEPRSVDPDQERDGPPRTTSEAEIDPPWYVRWIGQTGVYMGTVAVALAGGGVTLSWQGIQPYGNIGMTFGLVLAVLAMILGTVFQVYLSDFDGLSLS